MRTKGLACREGDEGVYVLDESALYFAPPRNMLGIKRKFWFQSLERYCFTQLDMLRLVDKAKAALSQEVNEAIGAKSLVLLVHKVGPRQVLSSENKAFAHRPLKLVT